MTAQVEDHDPELAGELANLVKPVVEGLRPTVQQHERRAVGEPKDLGVKLGSVGRGHSQRLAARRSLEQRPLRVRGDAPRVAVLGERSARDRRSSERGDADEPAPVSHRSQGYMVVGSRIGPDT